MRNSSLPQFVVEDHSDSASIVTRIENKERVDILFKGLDSKCCKRRTRNVIYRSFIPQHVAMMGYDDPDNQELKEEAEYVKRYIRRLM